MFETLKICSVDIFDQDVAASADVQEQPDSAMKAAALASKGILCRWHPSIYTLRARMAYLTMLRSSTVFA